MDQSVSWLQRYEREHEDLSYAWLYWTAVPMVVVGAVGILWNMPIPEAFAEISPLLNWGSAFLMVTVVYYFIISISLAIGLLPFVIGLAVFELWLQHSDYSPMRVSSGLLAAGIIGLWLGRRHRFGALLADLQTIMIGPAWLLSVLYRRIGIPY